LHPILLLQRLFDNFGFIFFARKKHKSRKENDYIPDGFPDFFHPKISYDNHIDIIIMAILHNKIPNSKFQIPKSK
jgi:hypothetical protein